MSDSISRRVSLAGVLPGLRQARSRLVLPFAPLLAVAACRGDIVSPPQAASITFGADTVWALLTPVSRAGDDTFVAHLRQ